MSYYIDISYFVGDIDIPNTDSTNKNNLELAIKHYEGEFLTRFLGGTLYQQVLDATTFPGITVTGVYEDLVKGASFTDSNGNANYSEGLTGLYLFDNGSFKRSMIANYVYWQWMRQRSSQTVGVGVAKSKVENMMQVSPNEKMVKAWNEMVDLISVVHDYLIINKTDFPDYIGIKYPPIPHPNWSQIECMQPNQKLFIKHTIM